MAVDIVINETIDSVDITVNPNIIEVNVTRTSGGGGSQTLAQTLDLGNQTGGENILVNNADAIELENTSSLQKGTYNFGGNGGISRICSNNYEDMWQNGFRHVFDQSGFIRNSTNCFNIVPDETFDVTLRFKVDSLWTLDDGTTYKCTDATEGAAVWEIYHNFIPNLTQVLTQGDRVWDGINDDYTFQAIDIARMLLQQDNVGTPIFTIDGDLDNDFPINCVLKFQSWLQPSQLEAINGALIYVQGNGGSLTTYNFNVGDYCELKKVNANSWFLNVSNTITTPIPTNTSDLTNDGADGVNPFITALDIPTTGQASTLVREVKNMTGATLTKGTVVYISGANGNKALVSKAIATTDALSARTFGLLQSDILNNGLGNCVIIGDLSGINTSSFADGAQLYLSGTVAGAFTDTRVLAPTHLVYVGKVTRSHPTQGQIEVQIQNGYELAEIHDVSITSVTNNQLLAYTSATELWQNKNLIDILKDFNKTKGIYFFEEFMGSQSGSVTTNFGGLISSQSGLAAACATTATITNRTNQQGVVRSQTGTTATGIAGYTYGNGSLFRGTGAITLETFVTVETLSTVTERFYKYFGYLGTGASVNPNNAILFLYDEAGSLAFGANAGSPNWKCVSINALSRTFFTSSVAVVAGQWYKLRIDINAAGTQASFYIDGNLITTLTTNIPSVATGMTIGSYIIKTVGTTARATQTDYFMYEEIFTNPR
jgi:hypothetical protein